MWLFKGVEKMKTWKKVWLYGLTGMAWAVSQMGISSAQSIHPVKENPNEKDDNIYLMPNTKVQNPSSPVNDLFSDELVEYSHYSHRSHSSHRSHYSHSSGSGYYPSGGGSRGGGGSGTNQPSAPADVIPISQIQKQLNDLGYSCGAVDGQKGAGTIAAIKDFQSEYGLSVTGTVDSETESYLDSTNIAIVRAALEKFGYNCGSTSGRNQETIANIYDFQARHDIEATGRINPATKSALGI